MDPGEAFEKVFVDLLVADVEALKRDGVSYREYSACVWPDIDSPQNKWQRIKTMSYGVGKKQNVTLADAYRMVAALGQDLGRFVVRVLDTMERQHPGIQQTIQGSSNIQVGGAVGGSISTGQAPAKPRRRKKHPGQR